MEEIKHLRVLIKMKDERIETLQKTIKIQEETITLLKERIWPTS